MISVLHVDGEAVRHDVHDGITQIRKERDLESPHRDDEGRLGGSVAVRNRRDYISD